MRKLFVTLAAAAAVLSAGLLTHPVDAMSLGASAARGAADRIGMVDNVRLVCTHWWDGEYHKRQVCREVYDEQPVVVAPPPLVVAPQPYYGGYGPYVRPGIGVYISDIRVKHDIVPLQRLANGLELYSYRYLWSDQVYVGVMAQDVQALRPDAVTQGADGLLRVDYKRLGMRLQTLEEWTAAQNRQASAQ